MVCICIVCSFVMFCVLEAASSTTVSVLVVSDLLVQPRSWLLLVIFNPSLLKYILRFLTFCVFKLCYIYLQRTRPLRSCMEAVTIPNATLDFSRRLRTTSLVVLFFLFFFHSCRVRFFGEHRHHERSSKLSFPCIFSRHVRLILAIWNGLISVAAVPARCCGPLCSVSMVWRLPYGAKWDISGQYWRQRRLVALQDAV